MATAFSAHEILLQQLVDLLGFEDGASAVLEHLLTIESSTDLSDFLQQLLGSDKETKLQKLVKDIAQFKACGTIEVAATESVSRNYTSHGRRADVKPNSNAPKNVPQKAIKTKPPPPPPPPRQTKQAPKPPSPQKQISGTNGSGVQLTKLLSTNGSGTQATKPLKPGATSAELQQIKKQAEPVQVQEKNPMQKTRPTRGQAKFICGCFGSFHKPLTNCLFCGRVSCEKEGYDFCPFCGHLVELVVGGGSDSATQHKDRLLQFDREHASRTTVLDDQADFFVNEQSLNWMTSEEEQQCLAAEDERAEQLRRHPKMKLGLNL